MTAITKREDNHKRLSYTKLKTLMDCEYCYYLRYVKRIETPDTAPLIFGSAVHNSIRIGYENKLPRDEWERAFVAEWKMLTAANDVQFSYEREFFTRLKEGKKTLLDYYDTYVDGKPEPKAIELRFKADDKIMVGDYCLIGAIDQIDEEDNVIDYKTGTKPVAFSLDFDLQLVMYAYAYRKLFGEKENKVIIRHLGTMTDMCPRSPTDHDFEVLEEEVAKLDKKLSTGVFLRNVSRSCAYCPYAYICLGKEKKTRRRY